MSIPLVDLKAQYQSIRGDVDAAIQGVIDRTAFIRSEDTLAFEREFAAYCDDGAAELHCASCGNGTDALYLAMRALGIGPGDEVITAAHTFIGSAEPITQTGARVVFVDVQPGTLLLDPAAVERAVTPRTRAIVAVHLYGQPCDMDALGDIARRRGLKLIEDAAQAHGARWTGRRVGTLGDAACFSFFPGKNLGAYGDGGAVVSRDAALIRKITMLANHGRQEKYAHDFEGVNSRLDGLQAAVLRVKLRHLDAWNAARRRIAGAFMKAWAQTGLTLPVVHPSAESVWHLFVVRSPRRDALAAALKAAGIATGIHYPIPLHRQPAYAYLNMPEGSLPVSEEAARTVLSVPIYAELTDAQVQQITRAVAQSCC